ncbi:MAG: PD40 domain-containing protein [Spirochaetales bacterium]|nr:PD40 domain-containing protein [Spirochaetales bacterium]
MRKTGATLFFLIVLFFVSTVRPQSDRLDSSVELAIPLTGSLQNPSFSPDNRSIVFTRFLRGYNEGPSEIYTYDLLSKKLRRIVSNDSDNVVMPGHAWRNGTICFASDYHGPTEDIFTVTEDGANVVQVTENREQGSYYIEPVFHPARSDIMAFEIGFLDGGKPHTLAVVERDRGDRVTRLLNDPEHDYRQPNWSWDGTRIVFQRADRGGDNWRIYTAAVDFSGNRPSLKKIRRLPQPEAGNTDNAWYSNDLSILSSSDDGGAYSSIYAFGVNGRAPLRISHSLQFEDGAPACSSDGRQVVFEAHTARDPSSPTRIRLIRLSREELRFLSQ